MLCDINLFCDNLSAIAWSCFFWGVFLNIVHTGMDKYEKLYIVIHFTIILSKKYLKWEVNFTFSFKKKKFF